MLMSGRGVSAGLVEFYVEPRKVGEGENGGGIYRSLSMLYQRY